MNKSGDKIATRRRIIRIILELEDHVHPNAIEAMAREFGHLAPVKSIKVRTEDIYHA